MLNFSPGARRQTLRHRNDSCERPDCPEPQATLDDEVFFVEKLVGRKKMEGYVYMWLAKWEGCVFSSSLADETDGDVGIR